MQDKLEFVLQGIKKALIDSKREPDSLILLAVSKGQTSDTILSAYQLGLHHFGENYLQEALTKINALKAYPIHWHFIGPIQSNKAKSIAEHFEWVHSVSRDTIAKLLNDARPKHLPPLNVCIQVNIAQELTKSGVATNELMALAKTIIALPRLRLKGLMLIPPIEGDSSYFEQLHALLDSLNTEFGLQMDTLSMGMSEDYISAIEAGSTIVRIGRGIFGERG
jgi:pyridoxal phosphate enzyme (YggS family)